MDLSCFKAYDIRGRIPDQLNPDLAEKIGFAYATILGTEKVVVGYDIRESSPELVEALCKGLRSAGADVYNIGMGGTEQVYFSTFHYQMDGGIMVTASHNPKDYNGLKMVMKDSRPVNGDTGLNAIKEMIASGGCDAMPEMSGAEYRLDAMDSYIQHLLGYINLKDLKPLKIVVNAGNGGAGIVIDEIERHLPFEFIKIHHDPDGSFPAGVPNPLLVENRTSTQQAVIEHGADFGIAWDGDFDRCFMFDENGDFIEGYYIVGLLAQQFLSHHPGEKIIHDPRLTWNTQAVVTEFGGTPIESKTGHAFIKQVMRETDAIYGGEMSAHHYFRSFAYCDSGMIPWLLIAELLGRTDAAFSSLLKERMSAFPASGEINRTLTQPQKVLEGIEQQYTEQADVVSFIDGLSMEFADWRFNLRLSNTEPLARLNVESRGNPALMKTRTDELLSAISALDNSTD
ncbi:phosphohexomutase domain-containing protein [Alkalimarinus alittae]|uniref:phosphomannomutase n=1 Tax=Alkalimarinus alittae TaxID=2961619 RepID=A0ABY6N2R8_9ALTE|nr:phosphomannomutase [Alkalimarinus alittae]UZE96302.1 phosphomannomutase [Alkalimarinus alittae]